MDWKKTILAAMAATGFVGIGSIALAQTPNAGCPGGPGMMRSHMRDMAADPAAFAERRLARLKADLKITDQQAPLWQDFADRVRGEAGRGMVAMQNQAQDLSLSAPERMARTADILRQRLTAMEAVNDSFRRLYDSLSPDQKRVADIHAARMGQGRHGGRGMAGPMGKG
jgi:hypothetical protein